MNEMLDDPLWVKKKYWDEGLPLQDVADLAGCTPADVAEHLREYRLRVRTPQEQIAREHAVLTWRILDFLEAKGGAGALEISAGLDVDPTAVAEVLRVLAEGGDVSRRGAGADVLSPMSPAVAAGAIHRSWVEERARRDAIGEPPSPPTGTPRPGSIHWRGVHGGMCEAGWEEFLSRPTSLRGLAEEVLFGPPRRGEGHHALQERRAMEARVSDLEDRCERLVEARAALEAQVARLEAAHGRAKMRAFSRAGRMLR